MNSAAPSRLSDIFRQIANLIGAPLMWVLASLGFFLDGARSAGEFSDMSANLLVPLGPAFSIWFPIFIGCIAYGILQALPHNRTDHLYRRTGWFTVAGFWLICGWAVITAYAPADYVQWGTALIFIPAVFALIIAMIRLSNARHTMMSGQWLIVLVPISLIAGWTSLAVFLNWTPIVYDLFADGQANLISSLLILAAALGFIVWMLRLSGCNPVYVIPPVWGLAFLAARHLGGSEVPVIGYAACIGIILLLAATFIGRPKFETSI